MQEIVRKKDNSWAVYRPKTNPKQKTKIVAKIPNRMKAKLTDLELFGSSDAKRDFVEKSFRDDKELKNIDQIKTRKGLQQHDLLAIKRGRDLVDKFIDKSVQNRILNSERATEKNKIEEDYDNNPIVGARGGDWSDIHQQPRPVAVGSKLSSRKPKRKQYIEAENKKEIENPIGSGELSHVSGQELSGGLGLAPRDTHLKVGTMNNNMQRDIQNKLVMPPEDKDKNIFSEFVESVVVDETIKQIGKNKFRLYSGSGKNLGTSKTKDGAEKREKQVNFFKNVKK